MKISDRIACRRQDILRAASRHGASSVHLFGSAARGDDGPASDADFLVSFDPDRSLLDQIALEMDLEAMLDCPVDLVVEGGISPHLESMIRAEARPL